MKKNVIIAAIFFFIVAHASTVFSETGSNGSQLDASLLLLQQQLHAMQMTHSGAAATDPVETAAILGTWNGKSPTMEPDGTCTTTPVVVTITKQCGNLVKGSIKALGVTVPVEGSFSSSALSLVGSKTGSVSWVASIFAIYSAASDEFTVQIFFFQKLNLVPNNVYDTSWKLSR